MDEGGLWMQAAFYWELFLKTGAPEVYLFYKQMLRETEPVSA